jgi:hypothetical protein
MDQENCPLDQPVGCHPHGHPWPPQAESKLLKPDPVILPRQKVNYSSLTPLFYRLHLVACFDLVNHIHPLCYLAKDGILPIEPGSILFEDVKL